MEIKTHLIDMAAYHKWAYKKLLIALKDLNNNEYYCDYGLFFKSIHYTLNHLLLVDTLWLARFNGTNPKLTSLSQELFSDRSRLEEALIKNSENWIDFINELKDTADTLHYTKTSGVHAKIPYLPTLTHVFNHGTHHRGQITTVISQLGYTIPELDFFYYLNEPK